MPYTDVADHTGYNFPWDPMVIVPFGGGGDDYHYFHHSKNVGNYADFFTFWDDLFGTNKRYHEYMQKKQSKLLEKAKQE